MRYRRSSEKNGANSALPLIFGSNAENKEYTGLLMPAWNRGFCRRRADNNVEPERGRPEIRWTSSMGMRVYTACARCAWDGPILR